MSFQTTLLRHSKLYTLDSVMDSPADKEERKREYNRLAQREFRRRRKEHVKNLEQAQREQSSEQSEEIERLRYQNEELRRENETLRAQIYGTPSSSTNHLMSTPLSVSNDINRAYSISPSLSAASLSGISRAGSPSASLRSDMVPMGALTLSSAVLSQNILAYDQSDMSSQPLSMVQPSGLHPNAQRSPESSGFRSVRPAMGSPFQSMIDVGEAQTLQVPGRIRATSQPNTLMTIPYDRVKARSEIMELFRPLLSNPTINPASTEYLLALASLSDSLPLALKPTKSQLEIPHYYGIDLIPSPSLRDRLLTVTSDVAQSFVMEIGMTGEREDSGQVIIWGDDALNELSWELNQATLERWGWLVGRGWVTRSNYWRSQRGIGPLPEW